MVGTEQRGERERKRNRFICGAGGRVYQRGSVNPSALNFQSNVNEPNQVAITGFS